MVKKYTDEKNITNMGVNIKITVIILKSPAIRSLKIKITINIKACPIKEISPVKAISVSYTHLDVYKRQGSCYY